jgi:hypothetical protein
MKNFTLICSAQWDLKKWIQPSDSDVYKSIADNQCYKFYSNVSQEDLIQYHTLHNTSLAKWMYELKNKVIFSHSQLFWDLKWETQCEISKIEFWTLWLSTHIATASDINTREAVVVSQLPYIEWMSLRDLFFLSEKQEQFECIQEILFAINSYYKNLFWFNMKHITDLPGELNKIQLQWINIKIICYKEWTLYLTITDLAKDIKEFVINNRVLVQNILMN